MLTYSQGDKRRYTGWAIFWNILSLAAMLAFGVFVFTSRPLVDRLMDVYPTASLVVVWGVGMLSYHQDAKLRLVGWAIFSQILAIACLVGLVVFGFKYRVWPNFFIAPPLAWLHVEFTKRWWAKPGAWW